MLKLNKVIDSVSPQPEELLGKARQLQQRPLGGSAVLARDALGFGAPKPCHGFLQV